MTSIILLSPLLQNPHFAHHRACRNVHLTMAFILSSVIQRGGYRWLPAGRRLRTVGMPPSGTVCSLEFQHQGIVVMRSEKLPMFKIWFPLPTRSSCSSQHSVPCAFRLVPFQVVIKISNTTRLGPMTMTQVLKDNTKAGRSGDGGDLYIGSVGDVPKIVHAVTLVAISVRPGLLLNSGGWIYGCRTWGGGGLAWRLLWIGHYGSQLLHRVTKDCCCCCFKLPGAGANLYFIRLFLSCLSCSLITSVASMAILCISSTLMTYLLTVSYPIYPLTSRDTIHSCTSGAQKRHLL